MIVFCDRIAIMRIKELARVSKDKIGYINVNGVKLEPNEEATFNYLTLFGFNIELIKPSLSF